MSTIQTSNLGIITSPVTNN